MKVLIIDNKTNKNNIDIEEAKEIIESENIQEVNSFKEASDLCDNHYYEYRDLASGKVNSKFRSCELGNGTLYEFYPPTGVVVCESFCVIVTKKTTKTN